jgi:protein-S-isoprenylcysteine O-methyltransferase Ste14
MSWKMAQAVVALPGTALIFIPTLIIYLASGTRFAHRLSGLADITLWIGLAAGCLGLALAVWTSTLFTRHGSGTPAPWNPPSRLVVRGPYRHVRNPMIIGAVLILVSEALILRSLPVALWTLIFLVANAVYFPLSEERRLEARFGDSYRAYKANVPRWLPRLRGWESEESSGM